MGILRTFFNVACFVLLMKAFLFFLSIMLQLIPMLSLYALAMFLDLDGQGYTRARAFILHTPTFLKTTTGIALVYFVCRWTMPWLSRTYARLPHAHQRHSWISRIISSGFAFFVVWAFVKTVVLGSESDDSRKTTKKDEERVKILVECLAYFVTTLFFGGGRKTLYRLYCIVALVATLFSGKGHVAAIWFLTVEALPFFENVRWWSHLHGRDRTRDTNDNVSRTFAVCEGCLHFVASVVLRLLSFPTLFLYLASRTEIDDVHLYTLLAWSAPLMLVHIGSFFT